MPLLSRREFLLGTAGVGTALALGCLPRQTQATQRPITSAAVLPHRVVHTHSDEATYWDYATDWYGDYVRQDIVDTMTDRGILALTNTSTRADAWHALIPSYTPGQKVAIKINLNNNPGDCGDSGQVIDALPQPINSIIRGLKAIGVAEADICVYDVTHAWHDGGMPARLVNKVTALYPSVQFYSYSPTDCSTAPGYSATEKIHFSPPAGKTITDRPVCNVLVDASYLINMPIMKKHGMAGVTLAFKNHFGSFDGCDNVHWSVTLDDMEYVHTYNGLVDIYNNPHIKNKTVLTVGDGLYGARINNYDEVPSPWTTLGNHSPNSLFFSVDPVAIDCVMYDHLDAQDGVLDGSDDYLKLASTAGLGTFEHWDAAHLYHSIDYQRIEVAHQYLPLVLEGDWEATSVSSLPWNKGHLNNDEKQDRGFIDISLPIGYTENVLRLRHDPISDSKGEEMIWKRYLAVGILSLWFFLFLYSTAYAYLDPGTGSYACQIMLAGLMGGLFLMKMYWTRIKDSLSRFLVKDKSEKDA